MLGFGRLVNEKARWTTHDEELWVDENRRARVLGSQTLSCRMACASSSAS